MLVTVIVPTFNRAHMIEKSIRSILNQTYQDIQIIVVDDGSTDDTEEVIRRIAVDASMPIRYIKKTNGGCASARNMGVKYAEGGFIAFLDSDDEFLPDAIGSLLEAMTSSHADFVYSPSIEVGINGRQAMNIPAAPGRPERFAREHFATLYSRSCCILYKRYIFDSLQFNETARYNEDSDFLQRVAINFKAAYSSTPTAKVYQHGANKSSNQMEISLALVRSYENILRDYPAFAASLGPLAARRLDEVKTDLIEVLMKYGELSDARAMADTMKRKNAVVSAGLFFKSDIPFALRRYYRLLIYIVRRLPVIIGSRLKNAWI